MNYGNQTKVSSQAREWMEKNQGKIQHLIGRIKKDDFTDHHNDFKKFESAPIGLLERINTEKQPHANQAENREAPLIPPQSNEINSPKPVAMLYLLIVVLATALLIASSLEVFGYGWQGWTKAIVLELAILALAASKITLNSWVGLGKVFVVKGTLVYFIVLSFSVLHTGVLADQSQKITNNTTLNDLIKERNEWQTSHDSYDSKTHPTAKGKALAEVSRLNKQIKAERSQSSASVESSVIKKEADTETMLRIALLLLNIIFGHKIARELATIKWPPLREERA